jgi:hypothetical protein
VHIQCIGNLRVSLKGCSVWNWISGKVICGNRSYRRQRANIPVKFSTDISLASALRSERVDMRPEVRLFTEWLLPRRGRAQFIWSGGNTRAAVYTNDWQLYTESCWQLPESAQAGAAWLALVCERINSLQMSATIWIGIEGIEVQLHDLQTSAADEGEWSALYLGTNWKGRSVIPTWWERYTIRNRTALVCSQSFYWQM